MVLHMTEEIEGQFECLRQNTEKCITCSVPIKKNSIMVNQLHTK